MQIPIPPFLDPDYLKQLLTENILRDNGRHLRNIVQF